MKILFIGDIVGKGGRRLVAALVPVLRRELECSMVIANGENMAGGGGMNRKCIKQISPAPLVDVITGGDHMWDQKELVGEIADFPQVLRPANASLCQPGKGYGVFVGANGVKVGVVSLQGRVFLQNQADCPFRVITEIVDELRRQTPIIMVDFHAEATSEKIAMGRYLDGKVSAVIGTHTHVPTADEQIFPGGTAFQSDVGMVGGAASILGRAIEPVVSRFVSGMPARFTVVESGIRLQATLIEVNPDTGRAVGIERVVREENSILKTGQEGETDS